MSGTVRTELSPGVALKTAVIAGIGLTVAIIGGMLLWSSTHDAGSDQQPPPNLAQEAEADLARRDFRPLSEPLQAILDDTAHRPVPTQAHPLLGRAAPDFTLRDPDGNPVTLSDQLKSGPVVLVFYYGYYCNHCVSQLFGLDKDIAKFRELGTTVLAVSADPSEQTRERYRQYGAFSFPVLSDPSNTAAKLYSTVTPGKAPGDEGELMHGTFVISRSGIVEWANRGGEPFTENRTLLIELNRTRQAHVKKE